MPRTDLRADDLRHLAERGIDEAEAARQLELLRHPPEPPPVVRACTVGDGIRRLEEGRHETLLGAWRRAAEAGRVAKLVPASGAATRMFADLHPLEPGFPPSEAARTLFERRAELAFAPALEAVLRGIRDPDPTAVARALVEPSGLGYGELPKALIPFHHHPSGPRTAFVEQLVEAAAYLTAGGNPCPVHFTVPVGHQGAFSRHLEAQRDGLEAELGLRLEVSFSIQDPATDTLCVDEDGSPFRDPRGRLLLRPSGHGALLRNLERFGGDLVVVKNIDNILPASRQAEVVHWKRLLIGLLVETETTLEAVSAQLESGDPAGAAERLAEALGLAAPSGDATSWIRDRLRRPLRVCGMVRNTGEPGGGPFWVAGREGTATPQIVESAQIDRGDPRQEAAWRAATHFNPVDLVCSMRDARGQRHVLESFVDPSAAFVSRKEHDGRPLLALERPGLWNGAMAGWNTVFVEVPGTTFAPVKTVLDLLRPEHQPDGAP